jgi:hypothetical protein
LKAIATDWKLDQLDQFKVRYEDIFEQMIKDQRFTSRETDTRWARKERTRCFESELFTQRLVKELDHSQNNSCLFFQSSKSRNKSFQFQARNKIINYIWTNIGWIGNKDDFYELLIYSMYAIPGLSGRARSRYSEDQLNKGYMKAIKLPINAGKMIIYFTSLIFCNHFSHV